MSNPLKDLGLEDLQAIAQLRGLKDYESMSRDELLSIIFPSKKKRKKKAKEVKKGKKPKTSFSKAKIEKIRKEFNESRYNFSKSKIKEIRKCLYEIENEKKPLRIKNKRD